MAISDKTIETVGLSPARTRSGRFARTAHSVPGGLKWILPGFIVSVGLIYYSIIYSGYLSFFDWGGGRSRMIPAGIDNYVEAFRDPVLRTALRNTLVYFVVVFGVQVIGGVMFAAAMHSKVYLSNLYKVIIVIPVVVAPATMAQAHIQVWQTNGTVNAILNGLGLDSLSQGWLGQSTTSLLVIIVVSSWGSIGFGFILYYAAMGQIVPEVLEAARIDGAGNLRMLFSVVVPMVRPITISLAILNFISALKLFDNVWLITQGGPAHSSEFMGTMIYSETAGTQRNLGYAAALSMILLVVAVGTAVTIQLKSREKTRKSKPSKSKRELSNV